MSDIWFCCGSGSAGQLGLEDYEDYSSPMQIKDIGACSISTGGCHSAGITLSGHLYTWGEAEHHQLGHGDTSNSCTPRKVDMLADEETTLVCCGWWHTIAFTKSRQLYSWGYNKDGQLGLPNEQDKDYVSIPKIVSRLSGILITSVACGWKHSLAATDHGRVFSWGTGRQGQLGHGPNRLVVKEPTMIASLENTFIVHVFCGWQHSACLSREEELKTWGSNKHGQLGVTTITTQEARVRATNSYIPRTVQWPRGVNVMIKACGCGWHHMVALTTSGVTISWGKGDHGQLGHGDYNSITEPSPITALHSVTVQDVGCGSEHSIAVDFERRALYTWGWGEHGNLGHGDTQNQCIPTKIEGLSRNDVVIVNVSLGGASTFVHAKMKRNMIQE